jgi:hypothetical protein
MTKTIYRDVRLTRDRTETDTQGIVHKIRSRTRTSKRVMKRIGDAIKAGHVVQMDTYYGDDGHEYANAVIIRE